MEDTSSFGIESSTQPQEDKDGYFSFKTHDMNEVGRSTSFLIFGGNYWDYYCSYIILASQVLASFGFLFCPYNYVATESTFSIYSVVLFGFIIMSSAIYKEFESVIRYISLYFQQSFKFMVLNLFHLSMMLCLGFATPAIVSKFLASQDYNDIPGLLTGIAGIFILFEADDLLFEQLEFKYKDKHKCSKVKIMSIRYIKRILVFFIIPIFVFIVFYYYFFKPKGYVICGIDNCDDDDKWDD